MTKRLFRPGSALIVITLVALLTASPASAANKEHQQMMADLRMLQEQAQLLQNMLGTLTEALKAVNARLDQQAEANRKSLADEKLLIDTLTKDLSIIREKVDDNNVRVGSLAQEVDALRQLVQQALSDSRVRPLSCRQPEARRRRPTAVRQLLPRPRRRAWPVRLRRRRTNRHTAITPPVSGIWRSTASKRSSRTSPRPRRLTRRSSISAARICRMRSTTRPWRRSTR
jgi:hypothetical protein